MKLTPAQQHLFWREWSAICRRNGWGKVEGEIERGRMLQNIGFESLTLVDKGKGFDAVLSAVRALSNPSDLDGQVDLENMERRRRSFAVDQLANELGWDYTLKILWDRFHVERVEDLNDEDLIKARNTLQARLSARKSKIVNRQSQEAECPF